MNEATREDAAKLVEFEGEEYLFYKSFPVHVALLRGTTADENGNITFEHESMMNEGLSVAMAAKNSGGIVIVQVEYVTKSGAMNPKEVKIPGILVDYVVQATDPMACWQTEGVYFEPAFPLLITTLQDLLGPDSVCYFCYKRRRRADMRFMKMAKKAFEMEPVRDDPGAESYNRENIFLYTIRAKRIDQMSDTK